MEYYIDVSDYTGMQALTGKTDPNDGMYTLLHSNVGKVEQNAYNFEKFYAPKAERFWSDNLHKNYNVLLIIFSSDIKSLI